MKHARIRYQGEVHNVAVEDNNAVRLADGTLLAEDQVEWLPPATGSMFALVFGQQAAIGEADGVAFFHGYGVDFALVTDACVFHLGLLIPQPRCW